MTTRTLHLLAILALAAGCLAGDDEALDIGDIEDDGEDGEEEDYVPFAGDVKKLNVGFNNGYASQFAYFPQFFSQSVPSPARLCHAYVQWNVAHQPPGFGSVADHSTRAFIADWLARAQGHCDEALISFKSMSPGDPPSTPAFAAAFEKFVATDWAAETGFTGTFAFTAWNEPNNGHRTGNGLGKPIPPRVAARYYLAAERACRTHGCKVAAGDFASNGSMWDDFRWNCANDNVAPRRLCDRKSSMNPEGRRASYLDVYKNEIANRATRFGFPRGFRPKYFAYHGWHDTNRYLNAGDHCSTYRTCTLRRLLRALRGSWGDVVIWNTEDGIGQFADSAPTDRQQACGAAFLLRLHTISPRVKRVYLTRLSGGPGRLLDNGVPRPAFHVLAKRRRHVSGGNCR
jgi:hypothetical protein